MILIGGGRRGADDGLRVGSTTVPPRNSIQTPTGKSIELKPEADIRS
jgi:hypothetical protein